MSTGERTITVCFVGNPNCGKTTLFNAFTGAKLKVANWPGVTVERMEGETSYKGRKIRVIDTPGIYSLTSYTMEELVTRRCIEEDGVDSNCQRCRCIISGEEPLSDDAAFRIKETSHSGSQYDGYHRRAWNGD